jgi:hypothetical protein
MSMRKPDVSLLAVRLLGRWTRLARQHVVLGAGCACGVGAVQLGDFEQQLLDYLRSKHGSLAADSIAELLRGVAKTGGSQARPLLEDLARSFDSFDELHRVTPGAGSALRG